MEQTLEQKKNALQAAGLNPLQAEGVTAGTGYSNLAIDSSILAPVKPVDYTLPNPVPPYPVKDLDVTTPALTPTAAEGEASSLNKRLQELNNALVGKSAYQAEQEKAQGIPDLVKTQNDLASKLKTIQNEALAIPQQLQIDATGRGITAGGLAPIQTAALRNNAIQALGVSSLLEASKGNLATAQSLADRAVAQKYDPIIEEINAKTKNLDLILKDPKATLEDKNRAQAQKDAQENNARKIELEKQNAKDIFTIATGAAANSSNFKPDGDPAHATISLTLDAISRATTKEEALKIAVSTGLAQPKTLPVSAQEYNFAVANGYKGTYTQYQNEDANRKALAAGGGVGSFIPLTTEDRQGLLSSGFSQAEITSIESDINKYGLEKVLEGVSNETQKEALRKAYGAKNTQQFLTKDYFATLFTEDQLKKAADEAGFRSTWSLWSTEKENYLKHLETLVAQYRKVGYTDQEILKLMQ